MRHSTGWRYHRATGTCPKKQWAHRNPEIQRIEACESAAVDPLCVTGPRGFQEPKWSGGACCSDTGQCKISNLADVAPPVVCLGVHIDPTEPAQTQAKRRAPKPRQTSIERTHVQRSHESADDATRPHLKVTKPYVADLEFPADKSDWLSDREGCGWYSA